MTDKEKLAKTLDEIGQYDLSETLYAGNTKKYSINDYK